jgi:5-formyltetrahydrofolate cyclo-ligase
VIEQSSNSHLFSKKKDLRKQLLQQRQAIAQADWQVKSVAICQHLLQSEVYREAHVVLAYMSTRQEPHLSALWTNSAPKQWGLSRCVGKELVWHSCSPSKAEQFQVGSYGILEPIATLPVIEPEEVDLILVPAVACDRKGFRLGYGGGFYDRLLSQPQWANKYTIGIVFEFAHLDHLPSDPWDCPMQAVCTETGWAKSESQISSSLNP